MTHGDLKAVEAAAREPDRDKVDLIYRGATSVSLTAKRATTHTPIVFFCRQRSRYNPGNAVNLRVAREIGLPIPAAVRYRADAVVE